MFEQTSQDWDMKTSENATTEKMSTPKAQESRPPRGVLESVVSSLTGSKGMSQGIARYFSKFQAPKATLVAVEKSFYGKKLLQFSQTPFDKIY